MSAVSKLGFTNDVFEQEDKHYITLFVVAECEVGEAKIMEPNKCKQWKWFALDSLPKPLFLPMTNVLAENPELKTKF